MRNVVRLLSSPLTAFLILLLLVNATSLFGFATFVKHPSLLARWPWTQDIFAVSYPLFSRLQMALAGLAMITPLMSTHRFRWVPAFIAVYALSFAMEFGGTSWGIPFGKYEYTGLLGPKIAGKVPYLIPLSWFTMALPSFWMASPPSSPLVEMSRFNWKRVLLGSGFLSCWDLTLDPAMSFLAPFWVWQEPGTYYGMPWRNLIGWIFTGFLLMIALELFRAHHWKEKLPKNFDFTLYGASLFLPLGMCMLSGLWGTLLFTASVFAGLVYATRTTSAALAKPDKPKFNSLHT